MNGPQPTGLQSPSAGSAETKNRFFSQEFADIAKLRDLSRKQGALAAKMRHRSAKYMTAMEKYRLKSTILKEKSILMKDRIPPIESDMKELESELRLGAQAVSSGGVRPRDQSKLHLKIRKLQEKIVKFQRKSAAYESKSTHYLSVSSQKKVVADTFLEKALIFENEATNLNSRADRLQKATENDVTETASRKI